MKKATGQVTMKTTGEDAQIPNALKKCKDVQVKQETVRW